MITGRRKMAFSLAHRFLAVLVVSILAAGIAGLAGAVPRPAGLAGSSEAARLKVTIARSLAGYPARFLSMYMDPDGRIVRRDQGGDTVSEGQAYGMLIAVARDDRKEFDAIWSWTSQHLLRPDGLLAWHWQDGRVVDQMPASDADIDAAWALSIAASRFASPGLSLEARRIAASVIAEETEQTAIGRVVVAGPWAVPSGTVEPGYFSPEAFTALRATTGDPRWSQIETTAGKILVLAMSGRRLPAEWMSVTGQGAVDPIGSPSQPTQPPTYELGAARVAAWWAASCAASQRSVAGSEWPVLAGTARAGAFGVTLSLAGQAQTSAANATMAVADGMAAGAAGHPAEAVSLLVSAVELDRRYPTYYGAAWIALGYLLATTHRLSSCPLL